MTTQTPTALLANEGEILQTAIASDPEAFGNLYRLHADTVRIQLERRVDPATAEDLTQEVFIKAFVGADKFEDQGRGMMPWLSVIARNASIDHFRKQNRTIPTEEITERPGKENTERSCMGRLALTEIFSSLTPDQADVMRALFVEAKSEAEHAAEAGITPTTVRTRVHRARRRLKKLRDAGQLTDVNL